LIDGEWAQTWRAQQPANAVIASIGSVYAPRR